MSRRNHLDEEVLWGEVLLPRGYYLLAPRKQLEMRPSTKLNTCLLEEASLLPSICFKAMYPPRISTPGGRQSKNMGSTKDGKVN
jgi:hypothetical protein